jgi:hypothetical protein
MDKQHIRLNTVLKNLKITIYLNIILISKTRYHLKAKQHMKVNINLIKLKLKGLIQQAIADIFQIEPNLKAKVDIMK